MSSPPNELASAIHFNSRKEWRSWLEKNHGSSNSQWLLFYKKHTDKRSLSYDEAVEEALCFGWIDGKLKRVDDEMHIQRYTPRRQGSVWSVSNKRRVQRMLLKGKMTPAGSKTLEGIDFSDEAIAAEEEEHKNPQLPEWAEKGIMADDTAGEFWNTLTASQKKQYIWWVTTAKREDTRQRRLGQLLERLREKKKPGVL